MTDDPLPRRLAAILYADVAGYSKLTGQDEDATHRRLSHCLDLISSTVNKHGGKVVHYAGDAVLACFNAASDALACAVEAQKDLQQRSQDRPDNECVKFRMGVNLGDVIEDRGDIYGNGVNVAARLESLAEPGGICVSESIRSAVGTKLSLQYESLGPQEVKNIEDPVLAHKVRIDTSTPSVSSDSTTTTLSPTASRPSIAILPFTNMSGDAEQEYFADGLTEDIITALSRFHSFFVIARNSTFTYKGQAVKIQQVGKELGARYVVEGSVRRAGNRVRITVQLIDASNGNHLWAKNYDRDLDDIFAVQDEVTQSIVTALPERIEAADLERGRRKGTDQMVAYDYFLRGRECHHKYEQEACRQGVQLLEKAVELDPNFAQAWAWLSCTVGQAWTRDYMPDSDKLWKRCVEAAKRSMELDREDSECHRITSEIRLLGRVYDEAEYHNERGLELNPNNPLLLAQRGYLLAYVGRPDEGVDWMNKVIRLDPFHPEAYYANLGIVLHAAHKYEDAIDVFKRVPEPKATHQAYRISCHAKLNQISQVDECKKKLLELDPDFTISSYARSLRYKHKADLEHYLEGLRAAGLPE
ncbi:MAG: adenylate/guanylate cyclase domain-containing protein [Arenicellales bacterium]|nr:adenylate/guanylate cyclase domain-containing protein [Arenicellales bacterium]